MTNGTGSNLLNAVLGSLVQSISGSPIASPGAKEGAQNIQGNLNSSQPFIEAVARDGGNAGDKPKAYLNILFFDERFEYVGEGSTAVRVQQAGSNSPTSTPFWKGPLLSSSNFFPI